FARAVDSAAGKPVAALETPGTDDLDLIELLRQFSSERSKRRCQAHDTQCGIVQHRLARGLDHAQLLDGAVAVDGYQHAQAAVDLLTTCFVRIVEVADALDLLAPLISIPGTDIAHGGGAVLSADPGALGIALDLLSQFGFEAGDLCAQLGAVECRGDFRLRLWWGLLLDVGLVALRAASGDDGLRRLRPGTARRCCRRGDLAY